MRILKTIAAVRRWRAMAGGPVVLVPTMGALHAGHASLMEKARKVAGPKGSVIASIFVNPTQFGPKEDLGRYPRPWAADRATCARLGVDAIFYPGAEEMYAVDRSTWVNEEAVSQGLCGASRPGHFRGVTTVVLKLFNIVQADVAVFGLKDLQQCRVIARMVRDLDVPIRLVWGETVREPDGLALSSRNTYLSAGERQQAPALRRGLLAARTAFRQGESRAARLRAIVAREIATAPLGTVDYIEVVDGASLAPVPRVRKGDAIALAVWFGKTRLIDNVVL
jgi:pantoate--beta-alanine ligase